MNDPKELPSNWELATLGQIAEVRLGKMLSPVAFGGDLRQLPYLRNENIRWGRVETADVKFMGFKPAEMERYAVEPGDLLICEGGEPGRCAVYSGPPATFMYQKALHRVRPYSSDVSVHYLQALLQYYAFSRTGFPRASETTIQHLPLEKMLALPVPLPPAAEQHRLVAAVDEQFTRLDVAIASLHRARANVNRHRAAVLATAAAGRLVPTEMELAHRAGRPFESGEKLRAQILAERCDSTSSRSRASRTARSHDQGGNWRTPCGWSYATVEELTPANRPCAYGVLQPGPDVADGILLVRVGDIDQGRISTASLKRIATGIANQYPRTRLRGREVLITLVGTIGRTAVVPAGLAGANVARAVGVIPLTTQVVPEWVEIWFRNPARISEMAGMAHEVARKTLNLEDVRSAIVALPPFAEQERIAAEVERRFAALEQVEATVDANLRRAERLRQSILKRAFEGKLVPQDPTDEPASVVPERIRAERATKTNTNVASRQSRVRSTSRRSQSAKSPRQPQLPI